MIKTRLTTLLRNSPPTVTPSTPAVEAARRLRERAGSGLVVVDHDTVVGVVSDSDIVALVAEECTDLPVGAFMSTPPVTASPEMTVAAAADRMREAGVRHLPVVEDGTCCGLVSANDLAPFVSRRRLGTVWEGEPFTAPEELEPQLAD